MCGIAGIVSTRALPDLPRVASAMGESIRYRGPDAGENWFAPEEAVALVHRRLAIVDLTAAGSQPMHSSCGRYVLIYNGEIYNAAELRRELESCGRTFRGHSDTEAFLEGVSEWGIRATVERLIGMFAFALWDKRRRVLTLGRDRLGIKPLYWAKFGSLFMFGSELKALRTVPGWTPKLDHDSIASYVRHNYIPSPHTIYEGVRKLEPGSILSLAYGGEPEIEAFWTLEEVVKKGMAARDEVAKRSDGSVVDELDALLSDAVARRMIADVPFGAFLSGGIDSSLVVALMQKASNTPVRTFSIGFREEGYNEADHAKRIAKHLRTDHTELYVSPEDALAVIPRLPAMYDEPFSDSSQIPTFLVSEMTRRHVTVALSGDGGDELFAGYNRYFLGESIRKSFARIPRPLRYLASSAIGCGTPALWDSVCHFVPKANRVPHIGDKLHKLASILREDESRLYQRLVSHWDDPAAIVVGASERASLLLAPDLSSRIPNYFERMQYLDTRTYLPDDILTKVDRASMAVSLEARVPILDHRVVELSWKLPMRFKIRAGKGKWILRQILGRYVPEPLFERPKMGFGVPIDRWLRGPLRDWAEDLLSDSALDQGGVFNAVPIRALWEEHLQGRRNWQYYLWDILMFQAWQREAGVD